MSLVLLDSVTQFPTFPDQYSTPSCSPKMQIPLLETAGMVPPVIGAGLENHDDRFCGDPTGHIIYTTVGIHRQHGSSIKLDSFFRRIEYGRARTGRCVL